MTGAAPAANERIQRKLTTILAADVAGYSRLMRADEEGTLATLSAYREVIDDLIARHDGRIFGTAGDSVMAEFASPVEAVRCGIAWQEQIAGRNSEQADDRKLVFRIGINVGDVMSRDDDLFGDGVNVAARLEGLAPPGGICVSGSVYEQVRHKLALDFDDLGPQSVKNLDEPVTAYRLVSGPVAAAVGAARVTKAKARAVPRNWRIAALAVSAAAIVVVAVVLLWPAPEQTPVAGKPSIAVLPFANLSGSPEQDYLARGLSEDLITDISKISGLLVAAREASSRYKDADIDLKKVGPELNVRYVIRGSVRRSNEVLRVSVRVVNTNTGYNLWAERYDRSAREIFALQDDITKHVVAALKLKLTTAEKKLVGKRTTANPAAYDLVLRARAARRRTTPKSNNEAGKLFEQAIALDPNYAQAYAELGPVYAFKWIFSGARDRTILDRGIAEVRKALEIDPALPSAYAELAWLYLWRRDHAVAIGLLERALELDASHSRSLVTLGFAHLMAGDPAKGLTYIQRARERMTIEPYYFGFSAAECYFYLNRREDAVRELKRSLAFNPRMFYAHRFLAVVYVEMGRMEEARAAIKEARRLNPRISISFLERQLPFKNREDVERQFPALRKLGFPE